MARRKQQDVTENPLYHDTWKLLQKYRDVVWSMELSVQQVKISFEKEYGQTIDEFLDSIYSAGQICRVQISSSMPAVFSGVIR